MAENCGRYLSKGAKIGVSGRIKHRKWESDQGTKYFTETIADSVEFLDSKRDRQQGQPQGWQQQQQPQQTQGELYPQNGPQGHGNGLGTGPSTVQETGTGAKFQDDGDDIPF